MKNEKAVVTKTAKDLVLNDQGLPMMKTLNDQLLYAGSLVASGMLPNTYKNAAQVVVAMQMATECGLVPGLGTLRRTANINGTPSFFAELPLAIVQKSGKMGDFTGYHFDESGKKISPENKNLKAKIFGYFASSKRTGGTTSYEEFYTLDMAKGAGLMGRAPWQKHPEDMLKWRAVGKLLKTLYADVLAGVSIAEYDHNTTVLDPKADKVESYGEDNGNSELNDRFKDEQNGPSKEADKGNIVDAEFRETRDTSCSKEDGQGVAGSPGEIVDTDTQASDSKNTNNIESRLEGNGSDDKDSGQAAGKDATEPGNVGSVSDGSVRTTVETNTGRGNRTESDLPPVIVSAPGDYIVTLGKFKGVKLMEISSEDLTLTRGKLGKYLDSLDGQKETKENNDIKNYYNAITKYFNPKAGLDV